MLRLDMDKFIGRKKEKDQIETFLRDSNKKAALVYGLRRVGKTSLLRECANSFDGVVINYFSLLAPLDENIQQLSSQAFEALGIEGVKADSLEFLFSYLKQQMDKKFLVIIDEYQFMKMGCDTLSLDSLFQKIIDLVLGDNTKLIITGSYMAMMREVLEEGNPLYGRFSLLLHLKDMDYYASSAFYEDATLRDKIAFYSIFGGSPNASRLINTSLSLKQNIVNLVLNSDGILRSYVENDLLKEIGKAEDAYRILSALGNGKRRYTEIAEKLGYSNPSYIDRTLKMLLKIEVIRKVHPINKKDDNKKVFYEISNNLVRFYYTYVYKNSEGVLSFLGSDKFYDKMIAPSIDTFISYRFEALAKEYFSRAVRVGLIDDDIIEIGSYWYDDKERRTNGEFDIALKDLNGRYSIVEVKFLRAPMSRALYEEEMEKITRIRELNVPAVYFVSSSGFDFSTTDANFITAEDIYSEKLKDIM